MAEDNSLDSFLTDNTQNNETTNNDGEGETRPVARPKLKKIKRAKIRPSVDLPAAPEKIMPENHENSQSDEQVAEVSIQSVENTPDDNTDKDETVSQPTSLVTAVDAHNISAADTQNPYVLDALPPELDYVDENMEEDFVPDVGYVKKSMVYIVAGICLLGGLFIGKAFFAEQKIENYGLEGVVANPDVPAGRPRCGLTDKSQACIFYMLNWYKQELNGRDFYKLAAQLTGREEYMIETDNLRYANVKIKPGHFAQLNIPALK